MQTLSLPPATSDGSAPKARWLGSVFEVELSQPHKKTEIRKRHLMQKLELQLRFFDQERIGKDAPGAEFSNGEESEKYPRVIVGEASGRILPPHCCWHHTGGPWGLPSRSGEVTSSPGFAKDPLVVSGSLSDDMLSCLPFSE